MAWGGNDSPRRGGFRRGAGGTTSARGRKGATASSSGPGALHSPGHSSTKRRAAAGLDGELEERREGMEAY
jgi:hypothetical protein